MSLTSHPDFEWLQEVNDLNFNEKAIALFHYQYQYNSFYKNYCDAIHCNPTHVAAITDIPFLPISFFKTQDIKTKSWEPQLTFCSSGTTGMTTSRHEVLHPEYYQQAFHQAFQKFYGSPQDILFLGLLPSYLERSNSSLVYMVKQFIEESKQTQSSFYLHDWEKLSKVLSQSKDKKIILIGVTFALLDFAEAFPMDLHHVIVMETGGMKGRREEWTRMAVHDFLKERWQLTSIHSEYGMTELLSQAYSSGQGIFTPGDTMKVLVREEQDPLSTFSSGNGCLNIIDLANIDSCAFIATEDMGKVNKDGSFEVLGRMDNAALRGCSLMVL